jgi:L-ascorbate metabolism protein UlaG (beta-lactamase superfamily)
MKKTSCILTVFCIILMASTVFAGQGFRPDPMCDEAPCLSLTPACVGGPVAKSANLLTWRWLGDANIELTYRGQVVLFSAYFPKIGRTPSPMIPEEIKRVDVLFLGHAHGDHMSEAAQVAVQTGAKVYAPRFAYEKLVDTGVPEQGILPLPAGQVHYVRTGEVYQFHGFTVEAIHINHSGINGPPPAPQGPTPASGAALAAYNNAAWDNIPLTPEEIAAKAAEMARGSMDPLIRTEGVMAYLFTFGKDFRVILYDSASTLNTPEIEAAMQRIGFTDVASVAYAGGHSHTQVPYTMVPIKLFNPKLFIPNHHGENYESVTERLFQAIRNEMPGAEGISPLYKEPICFNVKSHIATKISPSGSVWFYNTKK